MSLSTLPDLCLLTILNRIPLYDLLATVNRVCHRWASLRPIACHRRRSLILIENKTEYDNLIPRLCMNPLSKEVINDDGTHYYRPKYHLEYHTLFVAFNHESFKKLAFLFLNLTSLQIGQSIHSWTDSIEMMVHLLKECVVKLVHLNVSLHGNRFKRNSFHVGLIDSLFDQINQLSALKRLRIRVLVPLADGNDKLSTKLTILRQVEHFEYYDYLHMDFEDFFIDNIEEALKIENCSLKRISVGYLGSKLDGCSPKFRSLITDRMLFKADNLNAVCLFMSQFKSLEFLSIFTSLDISFAQFINTISHLTKLTFLKMSDLRHSFYEPTDVVPCVISSIKAVCFHISVAESYMKFDNLPLAATFPNLQVIQLEHNRQYCLYCSFDMNQFPGMSQPPMANCAQRFLKQLKQCAKLRKIFFDEQILTPDQL